MLSALTCGRARGVLGYWGLEGWRRRRSRGGGGDGGGAARPARAWWWPAAATARPRASEGAHAVQGVVSLETLARAGRFSSAGRHARLRPRRRRLSRVSGRHSQAVRAPRWAASSHTADNPRGNPDLVVERGRTGHARDQHLPGAPVHGAGSLRRGHRGPALRSTRRMWMHEKRVLFPPRRAGLPSLQRPSGGAWWCGYSTRARFAACARGA